MNKQIKTILFGTVLIAVGVLLAIFGGQSVINTIIAVCSLVIGVAILLLEIITISKKEPLSLLNTIISCSLISIGIGLLVGKINTSLFFDIVSFITMAVGIALIVYGVYSICTKHIFIGICQILVGTASFVISLLYILLDEFKTVFWIIFGVVVAIYGAFIIISCLADNKTKRKAKKAITVEAK